MLISSNDNIDYGDNIDHGPYTKIYQDHIAWSYGYKLICFDNQFSNCIKFILVINNLLNDMIKESEYCCKVIET